MDTLIAQRCSRRRVGVILSDKTGRVFMYRHPSAGVTAITTHPGTEHTWHEEARNTIYNWTGQYIDNIQVLSASALPEKCGKAIVGHYWVVLGATIDQIRPPMNAYPLYPELWTTQQHRQALLQRTIRYAHGELTQQQWDENPGLHPSWALLLTQPAMKFAYRMHISYDESVAINKLTSNRPFHPAQP